MKKTFLLTLALTLTSGALAQQTSKIDSATLDRYVQSLWSKVPDDWKVSNTQDETQKVCSEVRNQPSAAQFEAITKREMATVVFPADGVVIGDWKKGEIVAQRGTGGQFTDTAETYRGGNCYACHQLAPNEVSYGTLGPSLYQYGKTRGFKPEEAKAAFAKIYNAQGVMACSQMPRFGHNKFLTQDQIKDAVAFLFDPASPVNK